MGKQRFDCTKLRPSPRPHPKDHLSSPLPAPDSGPLTTPYPQPLQASSPKSTWILTPNSFEQDLECEVALSLLGHPGDHAVILSGNGRNISKIQGPWESERV